MKCSEIMKTDTECSQLEEPVLRIAERMRARNIGFIPVCDEEGRAVGTITDRDLTLRVLAEGRRPETTTAREIMSQGVIALQPEDDLADAEMLMSKHKISRVVCVDDTGRLVGIISLSDVAEWETGRKASAVLRSVAQREARA